MWGGGHDYMTKCITDRFNVEENFFESPMCLFSRLNRL